LDAQGFALAAQGLDFAAQGFALDAQGSAWATALLRGFAVLAEQGLVQPVATPKLNNEIAASVPKYFAFIEFFFVEIVKNEFSSGRSPIFWQELNPGPWYKLLC
jgi:hypothetical protein